MSAMDEARKAEELAKEAKLRGLPEYVVEAAKAVDDRLVADLVSDFRRGPSQPSSMAQKGPTVEPKKGTGWVNPVSTEPPGIRYVDQIADYFAKLDRVERVREAASLAAMSKKMP